MDEKAKQPHPMLDNLTMMGVTVLSASLLIALGGILLDRIGPKAIVDAFYANLATELFSIAITLLLIDRVVRARDAAENEERLTRLEHEEKKRLEHVIELQERIAAQIESQIAAEMSRYMASINESLHDKTNNA